MDKAGSHYAVGTAEPSSFKINQNNHQPKIVAKADIPKHRPLWLSELRKEVPTGAHYNIESTFGSEKTLFKTRGAAFKNGYEKYNRTCDIQKDIKVFNEAADRDERGVASYDIDRGLRATKKQVPAFSQTKGPQFELWSKGKFFFVDRIIIFNTLDLCRDKTG